MKQRLVWKRREFPELTGTRFVANGKGDVTDLTTVPYERVLVVK